MNSHRSQDQLRRLLHVLVDVKASKFRGADGAPVNGIISRDLNFRPVVEWNALMDFRRCDYGSCRSECCSFGARIEDRDYEYIKAGFTEIRKLCSSGMVNKDLSEFVDPPTLAEYGHTKVVDHKEGPSACTFFARGVGGMWGCAIHRCAQQYSKEPRLVKPTWCTLYPLTARDDFQKETRTFQKAMDYSECPCLMEFRENKMTPLLLYKVPDLIVLYGEEYTIRILESCMEVLRMHVKDLGKKITSLIMEA